MPARAIYKDVTADPRQGGQLVTALSLDEVGLHNYATKRDWRRVDADEARREGHDYFWPNMAGEFASNPLNQPFPNNVTETTIASLSWSDGVATATFDQTHIFVEGETVTLSGFNLDMFNGTFTIYNVTRTTFQFDVEAGAGAFLVTDAGDFIVTDAGDFIVTGMEGPFEDSGTVRSAMPINLVSMGRRPNGKTAVIMGTAARIFRFYAQENGDYFEPAGANAPYFALSGTNLPYFNDNPGDWIIIGNGYSVEGQRWEVENLNGYAVFNNGVDLPFTYRLEDDAVEPIYELREQGVARVGCISEYSGILMAGDISEIQQDRLAELFALTGDIDGGDVLASQSGNTVTLNEDFFTPSDLGRWMVFASGEIVQIYAYINARQVTVSGPSATLTNQTFKTRVKASQAGSTFSGSVTGSLNHTTMEVTLSSATSVTAGQIFRFTNGFESVVTAVTDPTHITLTLADDPGEDITGLPFWLVSAASYRLTATSAIFTSEMVGRTITFDNGDTRTITAFVDSLRVDVDSDMAMAFEFFGIEKPETYGRFTDESAINRIQYRVIWGMNDEPRRWNATAPAGITAGTNTLVFDYAVKSFETGQAVTVLGAGVEGGNLHATILNMVANRIAILDTAAATTVAGADVAQSDAFGSIVGFADLQADSSGIIRMKKLGKFQVIYKDTAIYVGAYTGLASNPFDFGDEIKPEGQTLYYRNTLASVSQDDSDFHIYAGEKAFYRFDLSSLRPREVPAMAACRNLFYEQARLEDTARIFAAVNALTQEVVFVFPSATSDKAIALDYRQGTASTTSAAFTAAATVKQPETGVSVGETENWFLMGTADGVALLYGLATEGVASWENAEAIHYRRHLNPYSTTKIAYDSMLAGGANNFGDDYNEKEINEYVPLLSSKSPDCALTVELLGARNTAEGMTLLPDMPYAMASPRTENLLSCFYTENYFQDRITVSGVDNPCRIAKRIWSVAGVGSKSVIRRVG